MPFPLAMLSAIPGLLDSFSGSGSSQGGQMPMLPLQDQLTSLLSNRLGGIGPDLHPAFQAQRDFMASQINAQAEDARRRGLEDIAATGGGRSGQAASLMGGIGRAAGTQRMGMESELGLQEQQAQQQAIMQAIQAALTMQGQYSQNYFGQQQLNQQNQQPGLFELLGAGAGLASNLFGAQGAFPNFFGLTQGQGSRDQNSAITDYYRMATNQLGMSGLPQIPPNWSVPNSNAGMNVTPPWQQ